MQREKTRAGRNNKSEGGKKHKLNEGETKILEYYVGSSSNTVNNTKIV